MRKLSAVCGLFMMLACSASALAADSSTKASTNAAVTSSSVQDANNPYFNPNGLLDGSTIWHSQSPAKFPEWIQLTLKKPATYSSFSMKAQPDSGSERVGRDRAPKDFKIQGMDKSGKWETLLEVKNAVFNNNDEVKKWPLAKKGSFSTYRLLINDTARHDVVTISQIAFE